MIANAAQASSALEVFASAVQPHERVPCSEWAEEHRTINDGSGAVGGQWDNDYFPWTREIIDAFENSPWCEGTVQMKPTQVGGSQLGVTRVGYLADQDPGPMLYLCSTLDVAREFSRDSFEPMIADTPVLQRRFLSGKKHHETRLQKPFIGGSLTIAGSGSPNAMISKPCRWVFIDEEDRLPDFPGMGSAREIAENRTREFGTIVRTGVFSWAHPTVPQRGVARTYFGQSTQEEWTMDCPHCKRPIIPSWDHVRMEPRKASTAVYVCPHEKCRRELGDAERWYATQRGRFETTLPKTELQHRRLRGFHLSRLCHPRVPLLDIARRYAACTGESQLRVFHNMEMGEAYLEARFLITEEAILAKQNKTMAPREIPANTWRITVGFDIQFANTIYYTVVAWTPNGNGHVIQYGKLDGFRACSALLRTWRAKPLGTEDPRGIDAAAMDFGYHKDEVYAFCRRRHGGVQCVPVKHDPSAKIDEPKGVRKDLFVDDLAPRHGKQVRLFLNRDIWMDRTMGRLSEEADPAIGGAFVMPPDCSDTLIEHLTANTRQPWFDKHGREHLRWAHERDRPDDYAQGLCYAEVAAVGLGLDEIEDVSDPKPPKDRDEITERFGRSKRGQSRRRGYVRGRSGR